MMRRMIRLWERHNEWRALVDIVNSGVSLVSGRRPLGANSEVTGFLDRMEFRDGRLSVSGWAARRGATLRSVRIGLVNGTKSMRFNATVGVQREDVTPLLDLPGYIAPGFVFSGDDPIPLSGHIQLELNFSDGTRTLVEIGDYDLLYDKRVVHRRVSQFAQFYAREVLPRWPLFVSSKTRSLARKSISRRLDTQQLFASRKLAVDIGSIHLEQPIIDRLPEPVDIVIPVYNGFELLGELFARILKHTTTPHRLIAVNDASPDPRIAQLLSTLRPSGLCENVVVLHNETNLGFVKSVNLGLERARGHVVILNTDVKVPAQWLERLMRPIFDDETIASTTPFTNCGTICSFPSFCRDNELLFGLSVDDIDTHFRALVPSENPTRMPTGIGFCMGLSRGFIDTIGPFDAETFGRGYGEENDWCCRAAAIGGQNILIQNLFVEHAHGGSFTSTEKKQLLEENLAKLSKRHSHYFKDVSYFISRDPAAPLRAMMSARIAACAAKSGFDILLDHDLGGGANRFREKRIERLIKRNKPFALILPSGQSGRFEFRIHAGDQFQSFFFRDWSVLHALFPETPGRPGLKTSWIVNNLLGFGDVQAVLQFLIERKQRFGNRLHMLMHDYLPACPSYNLLGKEGGHCGVPDIAVCRTCLPDNPFAASVAKDVPIEEWRKAWRHFLQACDKVVHFSRASRDVIVKSFPGLDAQMEIRPHTVGWAVRRNVEVFPMRGGEPLRIGVVGAIGVAKGADLVTKAANIMARKRLNMEIVVLGRLSQPVSGDRLRVLGPYRPQDLPGLIERERIHVFWIPSIWPETFSYVTTELMRLNVPIACFGLGAPRERLSTYRLGSVISRIDAASAIKELLALAQRANTRALERRKASRGKVEITTSRRRVVRADAVHTLH